MSINTLCNNVNSETVCYHPTQIHLQSHILQKNLQNEVYETNVTRLVWVRTWYLSLHLEYVDRFSECLWINDRHSSKAYETDPRSKEH
jgi:hypothetical protein